jgi:hypothetical protein
MGRVDERMDASGLERGQEILVDDRAAVFIETNPAGAAVVRFVGERESRVVPMRKVRTSVAPLPPGVNVPSP